MHKKPDFVSYIRSLLAVRIPHILHILVGYIKRYWKRILPIIVAFFCFFVFGVYRQKVLPDLFFYVPAGAEQVVINRPSRNISNIGEAITQVPDGAKAQFQQIELMLMVQMEQSTGGQLILIQSYKDFDPQEFLQTLNNGSEITSTYKRLSDNIYLFGTKKIVDGYDKPSPERVFFTGDIKDFGDTYKKYGMTIVSSNTSSLGLPRQFEQIFANVQYIVMAVNSQSSDISFASHVVFHQDKLFTGSKFKPVFSSYLKGSTIAYAELGSLSNILPTPQLNTSLTGEDLVKQAVLGELVQELEKNHMGIVLSKGSNSTNLGITVLADNPNIFASLKPWMPTVGQWLQNQEWLSGSQLSPVEKEKSLGYNLTLLEGQQIGILLEQDDNTTALRIGNPLIDGSSDQDLWYNNNTLATLSINLDQAIALYTQILNMGFNTNVETINALSEQFKGKFFNAHVFVEEHGLGLEGEIH